METILTLLNKIQAQCEELKQDILYLEQPYAGLIDIEQHEQAMQERNVDHANDGKI